MPIGCNSPPKNNDAGTLVLVGLLGTDITKKKNKTPIRRSDSRFSILNNRPNGLNKSNSIINSWNILKSVPRRCSYARAHTRNPSYETIISPRKYYYLFFLLLLIFSRVRAIKKRSARNPPAARCCVINALFRIKTRVLYT